MQRNLRNEFMVAFGAILIIGFGLLFAILLSGSGEDAAATAVSNAATASPTTEANTPDGTEPVAIPETLTETNIPAASEEASPATETPTAEASASNTPTETETEAPTATDEPSATEQASETASATPTEEAQATDAASATRRSTGRATRAATATEAIQPSATNTRRPSATATTEASATNTRRPSAIATTEASASPSPSLTQRPTATPTSQNAVTGIIPTPPPSPTVPPLNQPSRTPSSCQLPQGWTTYTVLAGNTLFAIALATNSTVDELRRANCIENIDNIQAGDVVFVPRAPLGPVATFVNTGSRAGLRPIGCTNPNVQITSPISAQRITGTFTVYGSASRSDFLYYKIEVRPDAASIYNFYLDSHSQVTNGVLGEINSELFGTGLHWIKLTVVDTQAQIPLDATCEIPMIFE